MKINRSYYCIVDQNNKPDYRYLFENPQDAKRKIKQIKNSTKGETVLFNQRKKDYFIDGIKKDFVNPYRKLAIKKGCWTGLRVEKFNSAGDLQPERLFEKIIRDKENQLSYSKRASKEINLPSFSLPKIKLPDFSDSLSWNFQDSFLKTRSFAAVITIALAITSVSLVFFQKNSAEKIAEEVAESRNQAMADEDQTKVLGEKKVVKINKGDDEIDSFVLESLKKFENLKKEELEQEVKEMVAGSPMEQMSPYIAQKDQKVAAFLVGIAKKESNFGRRVPVLNGEDCFNYWGYRGIRDRMGTGGHTCFDSPEDAVDTVGGRLQDLVQADIDTPEEMVIWKCGSSCAAHSDYSVQKWIDDVSIYFDKMERDSSTS